MKFISIDEIKEVVASKARYQKVMLLTDEQTNIEIAQKIHEGIKDLCIFNRRDINSLDEEISNGYKLIIYLVSPKNYLTCDIRKDEHINVIVADGKNLMPYCLNEKSHKINNYMATNNVSLDLNMLSSLYLNTFFNYFQNLILGMQEGEYFNILKEEITQQNLFKIIDKLENNFFFLDMDIIKKSNAKAEHSAVLDLILINAFIVLITSVKNQNLTLVDTYKVANDNQELIEKFYRMHFNAGFHQLITLNYNCLMNFANKTKEKILEVLSFMNVDGVDSLLLDLKEYCKNDTGICGYLYLYNMFEQWFNKIKQEIFIFCV